MTPRSLTMLVALAALVAAPLAHAIPEADYLREFHSTVVPFFETVGQAGEFQGVAGKAIRFRAFLHPAERGAVVFLPGQGESILIDAELIHDLWNAGYTVYAIDHEGQGSSGRVSRNSRVQYVESFDHYVADLRRLMVEQVIPAGHRRLFLLTNSMGGAIGTLYQAAYPGDFMRMATAVPMFEMNTRGVPEPVAYAAAAAASRLGGERLAPGEKDFDFERGKDCDASSDGRRLRGCAMMDLFRAHPETAVGGVSYRWLYEALKATRRIRAEEGAKVMIPWLLLQAGKDTRVMNGGQDETCAAARDCTKLVYPASSHRLLSESDSIREPALRAILGFFGR